MDLNILKNFCTSHFKRESTTSICHPSQHTYVLRYWKSSPRLNAMTLHWKTPNPGAFSNFISCQCLTRMSWQTVLRHAHKPWFMFQPDDRMTSCSACLIEMGGPGWCSRVKTNSLAVCWHLCRVAVLTVSLSHNVLDLNAVTADLQSHVKVYYLSSLHLSICPMLKGIFFSLLNLSTNSPK